MKMVRDMSFDTIYQLPIYPEVVDDNHVETVIPAYRD